MQEACLEVLYFLDGAAERRRREDVVLSAAVSSGVITVVQAWPEFFGAEPGAFPSRDADMSAFTLEKATPASYAADMAALVSSSSRVTLREPPAVPVPAVNGHAYFPDAEWT